MFTPCQRTTQQMGPEHGAILQSPPEANDQMTDGGPAQCGGLPDAMQSLQPTEWHFAKNSNEASRPSL